MISLVSGSTNKRKEYIDNYLKDFNSRAQHIYKDDIKEISLFSKIPQSMGLFDEVEIFVLHDLVRDISIKDFFEHYSDTKHEIIFSEESLLKKDKTVFEKNSVSITEFEKEKKENNSYNTFKLADLLGSRDKKNLWLEFQNARKKVSNEEIHGILFWQIKNLALVKFSDSNPGMNAFVYSKNQSYAEKFSEKEIKDFAQKLSYMFHNRDTYSTLDIEMEKFILEL